MSRIDEYRRIMRAARARATYPLARRTTHLSTCIQDNIPIDDCTYCHIFTEERNPMTMRQENTLGDKAARYHHLNTRAQEYVEKHGAWEILCHFCNHNLGEDVPAVAIAGQWDGGDEGIDPKWMPVCEAHLDGWWDDTDGSTETSHVQDRTEPATRRARLGKHHGSERI